MKTYREVVFAISDSLKKLSDDSLLEIEHYIYFINKYRALLIKQRYLDKKKEIPLAFYQRLNVGFDTNLPSKDIYKSMKRIPVSVDNGIIHSYTYVSFDGIGSMNLNLINPQRFKVIGYNKWLKNELYVTIDLDKYMYIRGQSITPIAIQNEDGSINYAIDETSEYQFILDALSGSLLLYDTILDNPIEADIFNNINTLDVLDLEFPCDESLVQTIIELVINEISKLNGIQRDNTNNAADDAPIENRRSR